MAKKGQQVQLITEVSNEEEWDKLLGREGLIVVDVYSEWCGPCSGMAANLKKVKLEKGGDLLHLGAAKCDTIDDLKRFRNKSEPTWLFISNRHMVNLMFGANAPHLVRLVEEELAKEKAYREGQANRDFIKITEMHEDELVRYETEQSAIRQQKQAEEDKKTAELHMRRIQECNNIVEGQPNIGVILVFPHAKDKVMEQLNEPIAEVGLSIGPFEKIQLNEAQIHEMMYFAEEAFHFSPDTIEQVTKPGVMTQVYKIQPDKKTVELTEPIEELLLKLVYGKMMKPPGTAGSPANEMIMEAEVTDDETGEAVTKRYIGIWTPPNNFVCASAKKLFYPKMTANYLIPEPPPEPEYLIFVFDCLRRRDIMELMKKYPKHIMRYGFFTGGDHIESSELVAKTLKQYEHTRGKSFKERMVIQLSRKKSECVFAFAQESPLYISPNSSEGKRQAKILFPDDYDEEPEDYAEYSALPTDVMAYLTDQNGGEESDEELDEEEEMIDEDEEEEEGDLAEIDMFNMFE